MMYRIEILKEDFFRQFVGCKLLDIIKNNNPQNEFDAVLGFYTGLNVKEYPLFLKDSLAGGRGYSSEVSFFLGPYEEDGCKVDKDEVHFWAQETETIIPLREFENLNIEFAQKALEASVKFKLKDMGYVDQQWIDVIKNWIKAKEK